jgi:hypothetical protein
MATTRIGTFVLLLILAAASTAQCSSIVVDPDQTPLPGEFLYSLAVPEPGGITFNPGDKIVFSGMSGVTDAFTPPDELAAAFGNFVSFTSTTATFAFGFLPSCTGCGTSDHFPNDDNAPFDALAIDPPAGTTVGLIEWEIIQGGVVTFSGTVLGPVSATVPAPEPSSLLLLGLALLSLQMTKKLKPTPTP